MSKARLVLDLCVVIHYVSAMKKEKRLYDTALNF